MGGVARRWGAGGVPTRASVGGVGTRGLLGGVVTRGSEGGVGVRAAAEGGRRSAGEKVPGRRRSMVDLKRAKAASRSSLTTRASKKPGCLDFSISDVALARRSCILSSVSVPRPRRRASSWSCEGGSMKTKRALEAAREALTFWAPCSQGNGDGF